MDLGLKGKKAIVCAASKGLGRACAMSLAREGVELVITARTAADLEKTADEIRKETGAKVTAVAGDITTDAGRAAALAACPNPDILVNNAGGPPRGDFREWGRDEWIKAVDANMLTPIFLIKAVVDGMIARKFGRIVNITSASVKSPIPELGMSNGARAGLTGFVAGLARQIAKHNVIINNILPGPFLTDRLRSGFQEAARASNRPVDELVQERAKNSYTRPRRRSGRVRRRLRLPVLGQDRLHRRPEPDSRRRQVQFVDRMTDPTFLPAWRLAELIRGGAMSCLELLDHYIARIERLDGRTNAVVVRDFDRARERARKLDWPAQGRSRHTAVRRADDGEGKLQPRRPADHLGLTRRSATARHTRTRWPCSVSPRPARWCSARPTCRWTSPTGRASIRSTARPPIRGTSRIRRAVRPGGGAAAMAAGLAALEIGSDIGGSIRVPAHYCGVFGHKPSWGLCSSRGQSLVPIAGMTDIAVIGPLARSADGPVAGAGRDRRRRSAAGCRQRDTAAAARRCGCRSSASPSGRASLARRPIPRPRRISTRWPSSWNGKARRSAAPRGLSSMRPRRSISTSGCSALHSADARARRCWRACATPRRGDRPTT